MILSKVWKRLFDELEHTKQRWYCYCRTRYKTKFGLIIEIVIKGVCHWMRASFPGQEIQNIIFAQIEKQFTQYDTPQELYGVLPNVYPLDRELFVKPIADHEGHYKFNKELFYGLPELEWNLLYNMKSVRSKALNQMGVTEEEFKQAVEGLQEVIKRFHGTKLGKLTSDPAVI